MNFLRVEDFNAFLPSSELRRNTAFYAKVPNCWDILNPITRINAVGWIEVYGEELEELIIFFNRDFTVGAGPQCTYQLNEPGVPPVCFQVSVSNRAIECTNIGLPTLVVNDRQRIQNQKIEHEKECFIKIPNFKTTFTVHKLRLATVIPEEDTLEYMQQIGRRYKLTTQRIGQGRSNTVRLAIDLEKCQRVAVKVLQHGQEKSTVNKTYLFLDYMAGGSLARYISRRGPLPEMEVKNIFRQLFEGIVFLHNEKVAHGDIRPANILLNADCQSPQVVYTDFKMAQFIRPHMRYAFCGKKPYSAPEVILSAHLRENILAAARAEEDQTIYNKLTSPPLSIHGYDTPIDMWSLGVILYEMLLGHCPYDGGQSAYKYIKNILQTPLDFEQENQLSSEAIELIKQLLDINKRTRLTAEDALNSPWFDDMREANATEINEQINI
ncbi:kinase-like domain-containing protein [Syncephalis fuscata]|nr:kinase-like domain-containing protein [Syncephalis fuscata]